MKTNQMKTPLPGKSALYLWLLGAMIGSNASHAALVAQWNFDSQTLANTGTSGSVHDGTFMNSNGDSLYSTDTVSGTGYSLKVDSIADSATTVGGEFLQINNTDSDVAGYVNTFDAASAYSYSMWVKADSSWYQWDEFGGKGSESGTGGTGDGWTLRARNFNTHSQDGIRLQSYTDGLVARDSNVTVDVRDQQWHLLTFTYDSTDGALNLYIDGTLEGSQSGVNIAGTETYSLVFGAREDGSRGENILIDSIEFYDTALTAGEVAALVPEPGSLSLLGFALGPLALARRRKTS